MALDFGDHDDVVFDRAPLITVLSQVRFPPIMALISEAGIAGFQAAIRENYPTMLPVEQGTAIQLNPSGIGVNQAPPVWRFQDETEAWTVGLATEFISLETPSYFDIDQFLLRFSRILHAAHKTLRLAPSTRLGMRKVNLLPVSGANPASDAAAFLRPEFAGPLAFKGFPTEVTAVSNYLEFKDGSTSLAVRSGIGRAGPDERLGYILDLDCSTEDRIEIDGGDALSSRLREFSDGMTSFFHWAVDARYKATLGAQPRRSPAVQGA